MRRGYTPLTREHQAARTWTHPTRPPLTGSEARTRTHLLRGPYKPTSACKKRRSRLGTCVQRPPHRKGTCVQCLTAEQRHTPSQARSRDAYTKSGRVGSKTRALTSPDARNFHTLTRLSPLSRTHSQTITGRTHPTQDALSQLAHRTHSRNTRIHHHGPGTTSTGHDQPPDHPW